MIAVADRIRILGESRRTRRIAIRVGRVRGDVRRRRAREVRRRQGETRRVQDAEEDARPRPAARTERIADDGGTPSPATSWRTRGTSRSTLEEVSRRKGALDEEKGAALAPRRPETRKSRGGTTARDALEREEREGSGAKRAASRETRSSLRETRAKIRGRAVRDRVSPRNDEGIGAGRRARASGGAGRGGENSRRVREASGRGGRGRREISRRKGGDEGKYGLGDGEDGRALGTRIGYWTPRRERRGGNAPTRREACRTRAARTCSACDDETRG